MISATCSSCGAQLETCLTAQDHSVSHETFTIAQCRSCHLLQTIPALKEHELSKYYESTDYVSHTAKSNNITNRLFLLARHFTLRWKYKLLPKGSNQKMLDYGCGTGDFLAYCFEKGLVAEGLEPNAGARELAANKSRATIHKTNETLQEKYSIITLWHVLEHLPNLPATIQLLKKILEPDGTLIIAVPNHKSWDAKKYGTHWAAYDVPRHQWHFSQDTLASLLEKYGLKIEKRIPMKLDSYYVSLLSEKYKHLEQSTITSLLKAFINGTISNIKAASSGEYSSLIYFVRK